MSDPSNRNALVTAREPSAAQDSPLRPTEGALVHRPNQSNELANRPAGDLANPADFVIDEHDGEDAGDVALQDVAYFEDDDYVENVPMQNLNPKTGNEIGPHQGNQGNQGSQDNQAHSSASMNMLGNLNINVIQPSMNMFRTRVARTGQPRPQAPAGDQPAPEPAQNPEEDFNMKFYKPRPDPKRKYFIGGMGVMMAGLVTSSSLYGSCAANQRKATARHTTSRSSIMSTPTVTSILTSTSRSTATSVSTTSVTITPSTSRTTQSNTVTTTTSLPPTTITVSRTSVSPTTLTLTFTPQPIVVTSTVQVTLPPVTVVKTRTCIFFCT